MRIGIAALGTSLGSSGGTDIYTLDLVEALADYDQLHIYTIIVNESNANVWAYRQWPAHINFVGLHVSEPQQSLPLRAWRRLRRTVGLSVPPQFGEHYLARQIDNLDLDLLHLPRTIFYPMPLRTPGVLTFFDLQHEYYPQFFTKKELEFRNRTYKSSVEKAVHVIAPSEFTRKSLIEKYEVPADKISLIPVGLSDKFLRSKTGEKDSMHLRSDLPDNFIFYPANPWQHKNHARLMAALRIYQDRYNEAPSLVLSGRLPNERRDFISLAIASGIEDRVIDLGFVSSEDLRTLYSAATMMIFPSFFEGFGIPLIEAMACGCPIAGANATTVPEITNGAALLFDPFNPEAISDAIYRLRYDPALRTKLVELGYQQLVRFDWKTIIPQLVGVYEQVANVQS